MKERPAELVFEHLDCLRERGLRHSAAPGRARKVKLIAQDQKVANLMHFHAAGPQLRATISIVRDSGSELMVTATITT